MRLEDIENSLPNGFHDSEIRSLQLDYEKRTAKIMLDIWVGDLSSKEDSIREAYQKVNLLIKDFLYFVIEPPDPTYPYSKPSSLRIGAGSLITEPLGKETNLPDNLPGGAFAYWFFINNWNSFIYFAAMDAILELRE